MKRSGCEVCGKSDTLLFRCGRCDGLFCVEHHLPEKHVCPNIPKTQPVFVKSPVYSQKTCSPTNKYQPKNNVAKKVAMGFSVLLIIAFLVWAVTYQTPLIVSETKPTTSFNPSPTPMRYTFASTQELIEYLRADDLSDREWTESYTCDNFTKDFIKRAEEKNYYCFSYYGLWNDYLDRYNEAVGSIVVVKEVSFGTETRFYQVENNGGDGVGHAVVQVLVEGKMLLVDPQTDVVLDSNFSVIYEGEITE